MHKGAFLVRGIHPSSIRLHVRQPLHAVVDNTRRGSVVVQARGESPGGSSGCRYRDLVAPTSRVQDALSPIWVRGSGGRHLLQTGGRGRKVYFYLQRDRGRTREWPTPLSTIRGCTDLARLQFHVHFSTAKSGVEVRDELWELLLTVLAGLKTIACGASVVALVCLQVV